VTPPTVLQVVVGDFNGDGMADLAGVADDHTVWRKFHGETTWTQLPGHFTMLAAADLTYDGSDDLIGLDTAHNIWLMVDVVDGQHWGWVPGQLRVIIAGDYNGDGYDDLAGIDPWGNMWIRYAGRGWGWLPGYLTSMETVPGEGQDDIEGFNGLGCYRMHGFAQWTGVPCGP